MTFTLNQKMDMRRITIVSISFLAILIVMNTIQSIIPISAQLDPNYALNNTLFVSGSATENTKADKVILSLGVETTDKTAKKALLSNSNLMNKVVDALKESGVQGNETSTSAFSIKPTYNYSKYGERGNLIGFTVSNSINIESSNINNVSQWIDTSVQAGANTVNDIYFRVSEEKLQNIKNVLLKEAVDNAKAKADIVAAASGLTITGIKSISIGELALPPVPGPLYSKAVSSDEASSTPILAGEQEVSAIVSIAYLLSQ